LNADFKVPWLYMYIGLMTVNDEWEKIQQLTTGWTIWGSNPGGGKVFHNH
jgi:hypothetical protein